LGDVVSRRVWPDGGLRFYPGFRKQKVVEPVFIIAPPRSGTTLTQKLMALDEERLVHAKLTRRSFRRSVTSASSIVFTWVDQRIGHPMGKVLGWAEKKFFGGWDDMHKLRLDQPEEDDGFFVYSFVTEAIYLCFHMWTNLGGGLSRCAGPGRSPQS